MLRRRVCDARETLIELRVHASSAAVMSPQGQQRRQELLNRLYELVSVCPRALAAPA